MPDLMKALARSTDSITEPMSITSSSPAYGRPAAADWRRPSKPFFRPCRSSASVASRPCRPRIWIAFELV